MVTEALKPMAGDVAGNDNGAVTDSRSLVDSLVASGALDPLFERIDGGRIELTGDGGLPGELTRVALERGLQAEMTSHLGYAPGDGGGRRRAAGMRTRATVRVPRRRPRRWERRPCRFPAAGTACSPRGWCPGVPGGRADWTR